MTEEQNKLYEKHLQVIFGTKQIESFSKSEIDETLNNLLLCLPNGGKLYKYKNINKRFNDTYYSLKNNYLWSSRADKFKDKTDCIVRFDAINDIEELEQYLRDNPKIILKVLMKAISLEVKNINVHFDDKMLTNMVDCFDEKTNELNTSQALKIFNKYGCKKEDNIRCVEIIKKVTKEFLESKEKLIKEMVNNFLNFNEEFRHKSFVCSLCEDYKNKKMWDDYANGDGICIEYDFNKLKTFTYEKKLLFISTYKVIYSDNIEDSSFVPLLKIYFEDENDAKIEKETTLKILKDTITKSKDYLIEQEWRIYHINLKGYDNGARLYADLVSGIIFDKKALYTKNGKKILALCKERKWEIKVRILNYVGTHYNYISYEEYEKLINRSIC